IQPSPIIRWIEEGACDAACEGQPSLWWRNVQGLVALLTVTRAILSVVCGLLVLSRGCRGWVLGGWLFLTLTLVGSRAFAWCGGRGRRWRAKGRAAGLRGVGAPIGANRARGCGLALCALAHQLFDLFLTGQAFGIRRGEQVCRRSEHAFVELVRLILD